MRKYHYKISMNTSAKLVLYLKTICFFMMAVFVLAGAGFFWQTAEAATVITDVNSVADFRKALENDAGGHIRLLTDIKFTKANAANEDHGVIVGSGYYTIDLNSHKIEYNYTGYIGDPVGTPLATFNTRGLVINGPGNIIGGTYAVDQGSRQGVLTINGGNLKGVIGSGMRVTQGIAIINGGSVTGNFYGVFHEDGIVVINAGEVKSVVKKNMGHPQVNYGVIRNDVFTGKANLEDVVLVVDNLTISKDSSIITGRNGGLVVNKSFTDNGTFTYETGLKSINSEAVLTNNAQVSISQDVTFRSLEIRQYCQLTITNGATVTVTDTYVNEGGGIYAKNGNLILEGSIDHRGHSEGIPQLAAIESERKGGVQEIVHEPSFWFLEEISNAQNSWMPEGRLYSFYQQDIRREEFAELVVRLYEAMSESVVPVPDTNPFTDTDLHHVLKAGSLQIVNGKGNGIFDPDGMITRQEMATMYSRLLTALEINPAITSEYVNFIDDEQISNYAKAPVQLMYKLDIIRGEGDSIIAPLKNSTREQAIAISNRIYEKFN